MAEGDFHPVDAIHGGVAGRRAAQGRHLGVGDKSHVHQVVLDIFRQVKGDQDPPLTNRQIAENAHLTNPAVPPAKAGQQENTTRMVGFKYTAKTPAIANWFFGVFGSSIPMT
jgi:hypothetical protein